MAVTFIATAARDARRHRDRSTSLLRHAGQTEVGGVAFWADSALLAAAGIPTVVYGPAGEGAHAEVEWVDVASAERCRDAYVACAAELCA